jgi:hypothetical protein
MVKGERRTRRVYTVSKFHSLDQEGSKAMLEVQLGVVIFTTARCYTIQNGANSMATL